MGGEEPVRHVLELVDRVLAALVETKLLHDGVLAHEARAVDEYKDEIVKSGADDIVGSSLFTGVYGNYLKGPIARAGMDPDNLPEADPSSMSFDGAKAWKDIWGSGQGIGAVKEVVGAGELVDRLEREYLAAKAKLAR